MIYKSVYHRGSHAKRGDLRMFRLGFWGRRPTDVCAEAGGVGAWLRWTADKKNGARTFLSAYGIKTNGWLRRTADVLARVEGSKIEIEIGIEIENLQNDPILGKYGERLGNLHPETRYLKWRSYASDFDSDPDFHFDNPQPSTRNEEPGTRTCPRDFSIQSVLIRWTAKPSVGNPLP